MFIVRIGITPHAVLCQNYLKIIEEFTRCHNFRIIRNINHAAKQHTILQQDSVRSQHNSTPKLIQFHFSLVQFQSVVN